MRSLVRLIGLLAILAMFAAACGADDTSGEEVVEEEAGDESTEAADGSDLVIVASNSIIGDVVGNVFADVDVEVIIPVGADPHDYQPSAQQIAALQSADLVVANGGSLEEGLIDILEAAEADGVVVFEMLEAVSTIEFGEDDHDDHDDHDDEEHGDEEEHDDHDDHDDEEHADEDDHDDHDDHDDEEHAHDHEGEDPHFFTDPARMAVAVDALAEFAIANVDGLDADAVTASAADYIVELEALDAEVESLVGALADDQRVLITNHDVFGYFADRYGFEVAGTIIPSGSTLDGTSAEALADLVDVIEDEGVAAIFGDVTASDELAETLASEVGEVSIVALFTEALGSADSGADTYLSMVRTNAELIVGALAS